MAGKQNVYAVILLSVIGYVTGIYSVKCVSSNRGLSLNCTEIFLGITVRSSIHLKLCQGPPTFSLKLDVDFIGRHVVRKDVKSVDIYLASNYSLVISLKALNMEGKVAVSVALKYRRSSGVVAVETPIYREVVKDPSCSLDVYLYNSIVNSLSNTTRHSEAERREMLSQSALNTYINELLKYYESKYKKRCVITNGGLTVHCNEALFGMTARYGIDIKLCQDSPTVAFYLDIDAFNIHFKKNGSVIEIPIPSVDNSSFVLTLTPVGNHGNVDIDLKMQYLINPRLSSIYNINVIDIPIYKVTWRDPKCDAKRLWHNSVRTGVLATIRNAVLKKQKFNVAAQLFAKKYLSELYPSKSSSSVIVNNHELTLMYVGKFLGKPARVGVHMRLCRCSPTVMSTLDLEALGIHARKNDTFIAASVAENISVKLTTSTSYAVNDVKISVKLAFLMSPSDVTLAEITIYEGTVRTPKCNVVVKDKPLERCSCDSVTVGFVVFFIVTFLFASALGGYHYYRRRIINKEVPPTDFTGGKSSGRNVPHYNTSYERHDDAHI